MYAILSLDFQYVFIFGDSFTFFTVSAVFVYCIAVQYFMMGTNYNVLIHFSSIYF